MRLRPGRAGKISISMDRTSPWTKDLSTLFESAGFIYFFFHLVSTAPIEYGRRDVASACWGPAKVCRTVTWPPRRSLFGAVHELVSRWGRSRDAYLSFSPQSNTIIFSLYLFSNAHKRSNRICCWRLHPLVCHTNLQHDKLTAFLSGANSSLRGCPFELQARLILEGRKKERRSL